MEREVCVLQVVSPCIVYKCMNPPFEHPLVSLKHIYWLPEFLSDCFESFFSLSNV